MKTIYVSSTYKDLVRHRAAVAGALERFGYRAMCMEKYLARDERTVDACRRDVEASDIYVGLFAWRYGFVPGKNNEPGQSITEMEYRTALGEKKPCLAFLLRERARWPERFRDTKTGEGDKGRRIRVLRKELMDRSPGLFVEPADLAMSVVAAVNQLVATKQVDTLTVFAEIKNSVDLGPSYLQNIRQKLAEARGAEIVELRLGPTPWWTTRLHLVSALAADCTSIRQFIILDADGTFVTMAAPMELRRALAMAQPQAERAYLASREATGAPPALVDIDSVIANYQINVFHAFGNREEKSLNLHATRESLAALGIRPSAQQLEKRGDAAATQRDVLRCSTPYAVLVVPGRPLQVIDRQQLAGELALRATELLAESDPVLQRRK